MILKSEAMSKKKTKIKKSEDPCWKDYHQVGIKKKEGKTVPNCVPKDK